MAFIVIYDACVLFPAPLRDLLIRVARTGVVQAHWSDQIIEECFHAVLRERTDLVPENLERTKVLMNRALPDANVTGHEPLIDSFELPDPDDRHVVAAAVRIGAQAIVTFNLDDFPAQALGPWGIEAWSPDEFLSDLVDHNANRVWGCLQRIADSRHRPPETIDDVLTQLERSGLIESTAELRAY